MHEMGLQLMGKTVGYRSCRGVSLGACNIAQWVGPFSSKPGSQNSIPGPQMVEGETDPPQIAL